ncbi:MAG: cyclic nucleotide-binding domain-containing protein [Oscillospiraceae bacterium]|nr:cyclic nucleotide-binding domain-containing protein [Oscillospiraceae bacterium]
MKRQHIRENDKNLLLQYGLSGIDFAQAERRLFEQDEFLSHAGEPIDCIYFVVSGKAKVFISLSSGKQLLLSYFTSKGIIGDIELMTDIPANYTAVRAVTELVCIALPLNIYSGELKKNNAFINYVAKELAEKLSQRAVNSAITTLYPLRSRLCAYIIQTESNGLFRETLTEVAGIVGSSYRHLLRCLEKMCSEKILSKEASGYRIINKRALSENAKDLYVLK